MPRHRCRVCCFTSHPDILEDYSSPPSGLGRLSNRVLIFEP